MMYYLPLLLCVSSMHYFHSLAESPRDLNTCQSSPNLVPTNGFMPTKKPKGLHNAITLKTNWAIGTVNVAPSGAHSDLTQA